jgi:penicillin-binding protein 2
MQHKVVLPVFLSLAGLFSIFLSGTSSAQSTAKKPPAQSAAARPKAAAPKAPASTQVRKKSRTYGEPAYPDATTGDVVDGEDLVVRRAAVEALGPRAGTVVVVDPGTGRVLTIVNQKMAFMSGFKPCSTIKLVTTVAALSEGLIDRTTQLRLSKRISMDLTEALAHSNNPYFAQLGTKLGFERVSYYARLFGIGEKAGLNIAGEEAGSFPDAPPKEINVGLMTS